METIIGHKRPFFSEMGNDLHSALERDPAARSAFEILLLYPGLHALWLHRINHWLWARGFKLISRWGSQIARGLTGVEIHPGAQIGSGLFIDHGMGVVLGETSVIGNEVTIYHGVTLGGTSLEKGKRHPTIGNRVTIGAGAKILGNIVIGDDSRIGANAVVVKTVPSNSVVVGVPGQIVRRTHPHLASDAPDLNHSQLPDIFGVTIKDLLERVEQLEGGVRTHEENKHHIHVKHGDESWDEIEFSI